MPLSESHSLEYEGDEIDLQQEKQDLKDLKQQIEKSQEVAPEIKARFELLSDANMPSWVKRYRIMKESVNGKKVDSKDIMGNFFECESGTLSLTMWVENSSLEEYISTKDNKNNTALVMPLPFVNNTWKTEWLTIQDWRRDVSEVMNYFGDNALVYFKDGKAGIIKVSIGNNSTKKERLTNPEIKATNPQEKLLLAKVLDPRNGYTVCQQFSIMDQWERSCKVIGQSLANQQEGGGRRYRFFVQTDTGTHGVVDFKEDITINQAIAIMKSNGVKKAVYADIIAYNVYFGDTDKNFYTREEGNDGESSYIKLPSTSIKLPNKNSLVIKGM